MAITKFNSKIQMIRSKDCCCWYQSWKTIKEYGLELMVKLTIALRLPCLISHTSRKQKLANHHVSLLDTMFDATNLYLGKWPLEKVGTEFNLPNCLIKTHLKKNYFIT
jgi:hypothetical protein